ncbi:MAG: vWA domain-containing protein [Luteolibacter sp.]
MSIHAQLSEEAQQRLAKQKRISTISSFLIAIMTIVLIALVLGFFLLPNLGKEDVQIVTYKSNMQDENEPVAEKVKTNVQRKPTAPSSSPVKTIVASTTSPTSIPTVDAVETVEALEFGDGDDFGTGWGDGTDFGSGGGASFFNQKVKASRIAYVIDYSLSMKQLNRNELMREELTKSVKGISPGTQYQLIFFAGPYWVAGDQLILKDRYAATIKGQNGKTYDWKGGKKNGAKDMAKYAPDWMPMSEANIKKSVKHIKDTPLNLGTSWAGPLEMAMRMKPAPQLIFFMTDGLTGGNIMKLTDDLAKEAKKKGIIINTVSLIEPAAEAAMYNLASKSGGVATLVDKRGKSKEIKK